MSRPPFVRLPSSMPGSKGYSKTLGMMVEVSTQTEFNEVSQQLAALGFTIAQESSEAVIYTKPKRLGAMEVLAIVVGLFFFLIPGLVYMMYWAAKGQPTVCVMKPEGQAASV
jgi:hypothetical protein